MLDPHVVSVAIRTVHVAAMAIMLGGAALLWMWLTVADKRPSPPSLPLELAQRFECLAWLATGLLVMTGIGNLAAFGAALPPPQTGWGERLTVKLALVAVLIVGSLLRTLLVALLAADARPLGSASRLGLLRAAYGATTIFASGVLLMAVALAHG